MKALRVALILAIAGLVLASCTTFKASGLAMTATPQQYTVIGDFRTEVWVNEFLGSSGGSKLLNVTADSTDPAVTDAIQREIRAKGGTAAINITIVHEASFFDLLLNVVTVGIYAPGNLVITGTVVR